MVRCSTTSVVVTVTENLTGGGNVTRYGNIYRFQNYCRHRRAAFPPSSHGTYSASVQRVYTAADANIWDYLPPQVTGSTETGGSDHLVEGQPARAQTTPVDRQPRLQHAAGTAPNAPQHALARADRHLVPLRDRLRSVHVTVENRNRYQQYKWSNIFVGTTHP